MMMLGRVYQQYDNDNQTSPTNASAAAAGAATSLWLLRLSLTARLYHCAWCECMVLLYMLSVYCLPQVQQLDEHAGAFNMRCLFLLCHRCSSFQEAAEVVADRALVPPRWMRMHGAADVCCLFLLCHRCSSFREAAEVVARQALPMFLNVSAAVTNWSADGTECSLVSKICPKCNI
jgi:hypothetical protein